MPTGKTRSKAEHTLAEHVKKALSTAETAPKQKHVRACIVYTWDFQSSLSFWSYLRMHPVLTDQVVCYKALITIHKVLVGGPHIVLSEALGQLSFFESCLRQHGSVTLGFGYGPLIQAYCEFIMAKPKVTEPCCLRQDSKKDSCPNASLSTICGPPTNTL